MSIRSKTLAPRGYTVQLVENSTFSAQEFQLLIVNTNSNKSINLPNYPQTGDTIWVYDGTRNAKTYNITIIGGLHNINGQSNYVISTSGQLTQFTFSEFTNDWLVTVLNSSQNVISINPNDIKINTETTNPLIFSYFNGSTYENLVKLIPNGAVELYYDNSKKLETTNSGVKITGILQSDGLSIDDNEIINIGNSNDLSLYHDGINSIIENDTGILQLKQNSASSITFSASAETMAKFTPNGNVELYYDNSKKLETTNSGVNVTGTINSTNLTIGNTQVGIPKTISISGQSNIVFDTIFDTLTLVAGSNINLTTAGKQITISTVNVLAGDQNSYIVDNVKFGFGFDGSSERSYIQHQITDLSLVNKTGSLNIIQNNTNATSLQYDNGSTIETLAKFTPNGNVELYYDNSKKLETTSTGITVSNGLSISINGSTSLENESGTFSIIQKDLSNIYLKSLTENMAIFIPNGAVELYYDNSKKLETTSTGITVSGIVNATDFNISGTGTISNYINSLKGVPSGLAFLDSSSKITSGQLNFATSDEVKTGTGIGLITGGNLLEYRGHGGCQLVLGGDSKLYLNGSYGNFSGLLIINGRLYKFIQSEGLATTSLSANTNYYIYAFWTGSAIRLVASSTPPGNHTDGIWIWPGNPGYTYVGIARTNASIAWEDSAQRRFVATFFNPYMREARGITGATRTTGSAVSVELTTVAERPEIVTCGSLGYVYCSYLITSTTSSYTVLDYGIDGLTGGVPIAGGLTGNIIGASSIYGVNLTAGHHYGAIYYKIANSGGTAQAWGGTHIGIVAFK